MSVPLVGQEKNLQQQQPLPAVTSSLASAAAASIQPVSASSAAAPISNKSATDITADVAHVKKKKKKKKKPAEATASSSQAMQRIAASIPLPSSSSAQLLSLNSATSAPPLAQELPSIFQAPGFPQLTDVEKKLLLDIFESWPLNRSICLWDITGLDLMTTWNTSIGAVSGNDAIGKKLIEFKDDFFVQFFLSYLHYVGSNTQIFAHQRAAECPRFFRTTNAMIPYLVRMMGQLEELRKQFIAAQPQPPKGAGKKTHEFFQKKQEAVTVPLDRLRNTVSILFKIYASAAPAQFLATKNLSIYREGSVLDRPSDQRLPSLRSFAQFVGECLLICNKCGAIGWRTNFFESLVILLDQIIKEGINPQNIFSFNHLYHHSSRDIGHDRAERLDALMRANIDPTFTHQAYWAAQGKVVKGSLSQPDFCAQLYQILVVTDLTDLWTQDCEITLSRNCLQPIGAKFYRPSTEYVSRLAFNLMRKLTFAMTPTVSNDAFADRFSVIISEPISKLSTALQEALNGIDLHAVAVSMSALFKEKRFALSNWTYCFEPFVQAVPEVTKLKPILTDMLKRSLAEISAAKAAGQLDNWKPADLKATLQDMLYDQTQNFACLIMIIEDARILYYGEEMDDILHLLPEELINLLELEGFDEIFAPVASPAAVSIAVTASSSAAPVTPPKSDDIPVASIEQPAVSSQPVKVTPPPADSSTKRVAVVSHLAASSSSAAALPPSRREFVQEKRRRVILRMLERGGYKYERTGRHPVYQHSSGRSVPVPLDIGAIGTRGSIYDLAFGPDPADRKDEFDEQ